MTLASTSLSGRVVVVTGASSGLGASTAVVCAAAGADLGLAARRAAGGSGGPRTSAASSDAGSWSSLPTSRWSRTASTWSTPRRPVFGEVHGLVNNAGLGTVVPAVKETPAQFRRVVDVNLLGVYWTSQAFGRVAAPGSAIVNVASVLALAPFDLPQAAYAASKAAVLG